MKYLPLLLCLLASCCLAADGSPIVRPHSVTFNYMDLGAGSYCKIVKGTTVAFKIESSGKTEVRGVSAFLFKESCNLNSRDSGGNTLGEVVNLIDDSRYDNHSKKEVPYYWFTFSRLPSLGSDRLNISGDVPVTVFSGATATQPIPIQNGSQLFLGNSTLEVKIPAGKMEDGQFNASFRVSSYGKRMEVIGMFFFDQEGKPLVEGTDYSRKGWGGGGSGGGGERDFFFEETSYSFQRDPGSSNIVLKYWAKEEEVSLPVPGEIPFHDTAQKK